MLSHHPMLLAPGAFDAGEWATLHGLLSPHAAAVSTAWAGHWHASVDQFDPDGIGFDVHVVDATWDDDNALVVVDVTRGPDGFIVAPRAVIVP